MTQSEIITAIQVLTPFTDIVPHGDVELKNKAIGKIKQLIELLNNFQLITFPDVNVNDKLGDS